MRRAIHRRGRRNGGFSLIELMVALGVLAFGLLSLMIVLATAVKQGGKGKHTSMAAAIARDQFEQILRRPFSDPQLAVTGGLVAVPWIANGGFNVGEVPVSVTTDSGTFTEFVYMVRYNIAADAGGSASLRDVNLQVSWTEDGDQNAKTLAFSGMFVDNDK